MVGSEKGEIAIIDLSTFGVVQRIAAPFDRCRVASVLFVSATMVLVMYNKNRESSVLQMLVPTKDGDGVKWSRSRERCFKSHVFCCMHYM